MLNTKDKDNLPFSLFPRSSKCYYPCKYIFVQVGVFDVGEDECDVVLACDLVDHMRYLWAGRAVGLALHGVHAYTFFLCQTALR